MVKHGRYLSRPLVFAQAGEPCKQGHIPQNRPVISSKNRHEPLDVPIDWLRIAKQWLFVMLVPDFHGHHQHENGEFQKLSQEDRGDTHKDGNITKTGNGVGAEQQISEEMLAAYRLTATAQFVWCHLIDGCFPWPRTISLIALRT